MTNRLWGAVKVAAPVLFGLSAVASFPLRAGERVCNGTLLQIQVNERGTSRSDRFRSRSVSTLNMPARMLR